MKKSFTLIELLVVIGIIAILAAMLMPVLGRVRGKAHQAACTGNMRQIGIAFILYLNEYDDVFPWAEDPVSSDPEYWLWMGRGWRETVGPYIGNASTESPTVLYCPTDNTAPDQWESTSYAYSLSFYHSPQQINEMDDPEYTWNTSLIRPSTPQTLNRVKSPGKKALAAEWLDNHSGGENDWWSWGGERNYLFTDGRVEYLDVEDNILPANSGLPDINLTENGIAGKDIE